MGREAQGSGGGFVIQTDDGGQFKLAAWSWAAIILGVAVAVSSLVLTAYLGLALTLVGGGLGLGLAAVGVGEGVRRARLGDAARIQAKAQMIASRGNPPLLPPEWENR